MGYMCGNLFRSFFSKGLSEGYNMAWVKAILGLLLLIIIILLVLACMGGLSDPDEPYERHFE